MAKVKKISTYFTYLLASFSVVIIINVIKGRLFDLTLIFEALSFSLMMLVAHQVGNILTKRFDKKLLLIPLFLIISTYVFFFL